MKSRIKIQQIPESRLKVGNPAYFYEEGYLSDEITDIKDNMLFFGKKNKFPKESAHEFYFTHEDKVYPLAYSQWMECLDNDWYDREKELDFEINKDGFAEIIIKPVEIGVTQRGFSLGEFKDDYGNSCSIQMSSIATRRCIWFGIDDADPKIMASDAIKRGIPTSETTGWIKYPIPSEVLLNTRMHLTREDVKKLLPLLEKFANTGDLD